MGRASLKLGISDSVVEVSLEGTIRLKEAELPRLMGLARNDVPLAWIATPLSRLAMTRCQQGLLRLCTIRLREQVPKTHGALHNSPKGSGASKAHGRRRAPRSLREVIFLVKKKFPY